MCQVQFYSLSVEPRDLQERYAWKEWNFNWVVELQRQREEKQSEWQAHSRREGNLHIGSQITVNLGNRWHLWGVPTFWMKLAENLWDRHALFSKANDPFSQINRSSMIHCNWITLLRILPCSELCSQLGFAYWIHHTFMVTISCFHP